ncbi:MAG: hypothetical protein AAFQ63_18165 [Cyanobacteria bacterium J06621_11]
MNTPAQTNPKWLALTAGLTLAAVGAMSSSAQAATYILNFDEGAGGNAIEYNDNGTLKMDQWSSSLGVTLSVDNDRNNSTGYLNLYDTSKKGRDNDLRTGSDYGTAAQGNVLIIQEEDGKSLKDGVYKADDEGAGGSINFAFDSAVLFEGFSLLDVDDDNHNGGPSEIEVSIGDFKIDVGEMLKKHRSESGYGNNKDVTYNANNEDADFAGVMLTQRSNKHGNNSLYEFKLDPTYFAGLRSENIKFKYEGSGAIADIKWSTGEDTPQEIPEPSAIGGLLMIGFIGKKLKQKRDLAAVSDLA